MHAWPARKLVRYSASKETTTLRVHGSQPTVAWPSNDCRVNVQRIFSKFFRIAWNVEKTLFDSRSTVAWPPTTVAWLFSDFFSKFLRIDWNVEKRCLRVGRQWRDLRPLSHDRSATFFENNPNCLKRPKTLFDSRPTVAWPPTTVAWPFSDFFQKNLWIVWNLEKTLFHNRPTVAWPPTTVAWPISDFFQKISELIETSKNVVWQSADGRVTSDYCRGTVQWLFSKLFLIAWNV